MGYSRIMLGIGGYSYLNAAKKHILDDKHARLGRLS